VKRAHFLPFLLFLLALGEGFGREIDFSPLAESNTSDSLHQVGAWRDPPAQDTTSQFPPSGLAPETKEPPKYVIRNFDHKEQVITASAVMSSIALMMVIMNNYNPR